jgi:hypothetical protein
VGCESTGGMRFRSWMLMQTCKIKMSEKLQCVTIPGSVNPYSMSTYKKIKLKTGFYMKKIYPAILFISFQ